MNIDLIDAEANLQFLKPGDKRWVSYLSGNQQANIFHHPAWSILLAESYSYEPFVLAAINSRGGIQAAIPMQKIRSFPGSQRLVSLPYTDHCAPLYEDLSSLKCLIDYLVALSLEGQFARIELRSEYPPCRGMDKSSNFVLHRIRLSPDTSVVSNRIKKKHFRQIKIAEQRGVRIERGIDTNFIKQFYHLHTLTRRRKGIPVQPWKFFDLLEQHITQKDLGFILLAYVEEECVAGAVFLNWNKTLVYKYSASNEKAREVLAMDLLLWTAIRWGCENGYDWMDMGKTDNDNEGLKYFKGRWGAEENPLEYCMIPENVYRPSSGSLVKMVQPIIQRSPLWVCRATGELLYRYFG